MNVARKFLCIAGFRYARKTFSMYLKGQIHGVCTRPILNNYKEYENLFENAEENFKEIVAPFSSEFRWLIGRIYNGTFEAVDVETYYSVIRKYRPKLIIEIGSGHSTYFALDAIKKNGCGNIISITLEPRRKLPKCVKYIQSKVEVVDVNIFKRLNKDDILFIDSSHTTEEAIYHIKEILPALNSGVIIHHYDILYPYKHYHQDNPTIFAEPDVILNFYLKNKDDYKIITSTSYVPYRNLELVKKLVKSFNWDLTRCPGSLWGRKS
jgi:cephalosporin hydroxylase